MRNQSYTGLNALAIRYEKKPKKRIRSELLHCFRNKKIRHIQGEHLTDIGIGQGQKSPALNSQKMEEGKSLAQANAPRKGQEGNSEEPEFPQDNPKQPGRWNWEQGIELSVFFYCKKCLGQKLSSLSSSNSVHHKVLK